MLPRREAKTNAAHARHEHKPYQAAALGVFRRLRREREDEREEGVGAKCAEMDFERGLFRARAGTQDAPQGIF